jgi:hypothetical protein
MPTREALLARLKGRDVVIPDFYSIFADWMPVEVNLYYQNLVSVSDKWLERYFTCPTITFDIFALADWSRHSIFDDKRKLSAPQASDFAFFAATWWPKAQYEELKVLMYFIIWLFNWDDQIDEPTGYYSEDLYGAEIYHTRTIHFILECLGLQDRLATQLSQAQDKIIGSFREISEPLAKAYTIGKS